ncbi:MAG: hypothetical protein QM784_16870 [Polyangiaceae bacterium]
MARSSTARISLRYGILGWLLIAALTGTACRKRTPAPVGNVKKTTVVALRPLQAASESLELDVGRAARTRVHVPIGAVAPTATVVVLGGEGEGLEHECERWHELTFKRFFTLCQRRIAEDDGRNPKAAEAELRAALRNLKRRFGEYVTAEGLVLIGVRSGAEDTAAMTRASEGFFTRVALIDGGFESWSAVDSASFARKANARALLICSSERCQLDATRVTASLRASGADTRLIRPSELTVANASEVRRSSLLWLTADARQKR